MPSQTVIFELTANPDMLATLPPNVLSDALAALSNFSTVLQDDEQTMRLYQQQGFSDQGASFGDPWAPLKESTIWEKFRKGYPLTPEVRTGTLQSQVGATVDESQANSVSVGIDLMAVPYAAAQDAGVPSRNLPARALVGVTGDEIDEMQATLDRYLESTGLPPGAIVVTPYVFSALN